MFFQIHKNSTLVKYTYLKQKHEKTRSELIEQKNALIHDVQLLKSRASVKADAQAKGMVPVRLDTIKKIEDIHDEQLQATT